MLTNGVREPRNITIVGKNTGQMSINKNDITQNILGRGSFGQFRSFYTAEKIFNSKQHRMDTFKKSRLTRLTNTSHNSQGFYPTGIVTT